MNYNNRGNSGSSGIGFVGLLQVAFIVLKLMNYINWSWLWVLSPMWVSFLILFILIVMATLLGSKKRKW